MEYHQLESGQMLKSHPIQDCQGDDGMYGVYCAVHKPMPGPWESWPRSWENERGILTRMCPHGALHPVAEMYNYARNTSKEHLLIHACDGCPCGPSQGHQLPDATTILGRVVEDQILMDLGAAKQTAVDLLASLWPRPASSTIVVDGPTWVRLRRLLCTIIDLEEKQ